MHSAEQITAIVNAIVFGAIIFMWSVYLTGGWMTRDHPRYALTDTPTGHSRLVIDLRSK